MTTDVVTETEVLAMLRQVIDPELGQNIVDLGLIYNVAIMGANVSVTMTLTTPGCPMHEIICSGVQNALLCLPGVEDATVHLVWEPPWHPSMMQASG